MSATAIANPGGISRVTVFAEECDRSVDGGPRSGSVIPGLFAPTVASESPGRCPAYDFRRTNSEDDGWYRAMNDLGWSVARRTACWAITTVGTKSLAALYVQLRVSGRGRRGGI